MWRDWIVALARWRVHRNGRASGNWMNIGYRVANGEWPPAPERAAVRDNVIELLHDAHCCAQCAIPMTTATAEDREDGLYCDKCLTELVDAGPSRAGEG